MSLMKLRLYGIHDVMQAVDTLRDNPAGQALAMAYKMLREHPHEIPPFSPSIRNA